MSVRLPSCILPSSIVLCLVLLLPLRAFAAAAPRTVLLLGDSLSAAHNIELQASWPALLETRLADMRPAWRLVNASISGETTSSGLARLPALLRQYRPALVILELGANDGLRGLPLAEISANLAALIAQCRDAGAKVLLLGIELPVNYGPRYRDGLRGIYADLARQDHAALLPFLLQGIALDPSLMQSDGLHPTAAAQPRVLANVWARLAPMLGAAPRVKPAG
ncbi:MAG: arylesterase [Xanthomonadaceae bacterium]|nr:arylesterase [Xanthomonadaceae bacterium]MDE2496840.1 arylesterase [Xanthomonadaceae bacterium]